MVKTGAEQTTSDWAIALGAELAARRAARLAERQAEVEAEAGRKRLPTEELQHRFAETVALVLDALDKFATASGISIEAAPPAATRLELRVGDALLRLRRVDDDMVVLVRGRSTSYESPIDLTDAFSPTESARAIAQEWIRLLAAAEEARHA